MPIPLRQNMRMGSYLIRQKLARREKFPLIVELEPLFVCNLACPGCGKIQYPTEILRKRLTPRTPLAPSRSAGRPWSRSPAESRSCIPRSRDGERADQEEALRLPVH